MGGREKGEGDSARLRMLKDAAHDTPNVIIIPSKRRWEVPVGVGEGELGPGEGRGHPESAATQLVIVELLV